MTIVYTIDGWSFIAIRIKTFRLYKERGRRVLIGLPGLNNRRPPPCELACVGANPKCNFLVKSWHFQIPAVLTRCSNINRTYVLAFEAFIDVASDACFWDYLWAYKMRYSTWIHFVFEAVRSTVHVSNSVVSFFRKSLFFCHVLSLRHIKRIQDRHGGLKDCKLFLVRNQSSWQKRWNDRFEGGLGALPR